MEGEIDFDPLTVQGEEDINEAVDDEYTSLLQQNNETDDVWRTRIKRRFGQGAKNAMARIRDLFRTRNPQTSVPEYLRLEDMDSDFYRNFSRAVESDTLEKYEWPREEYEDAREQYIREHGASNIPSWEDLPDQLLSSLFEEDPLTTIEGAKERLIELEPNINLDEIRLSKKNDKIYIRLLNKKSGKWTVAEPLFTKDGCIRAKVQSYEGFKEATRSKLQELKETDERVAALNKVAVLSKELEDYKKRLEDQLDIGSRLAKNRDATIEKYFTLKEEHAALQEQLKEAQRSLEEVSPGNNKALSNNLLKTLKEKENLLDEINELKQTLYENEINYMRQNNLLLDAQRAEKGQDDAKITEHVKERKAVEQQRDIARKGLEKALEEKNLKIIEVNDLNKIIDSSLEERRQLVQDIKIKEEQLRQVKQSLEDMEQQAERLKETIAYETRSEEEREAAEQQLRAIEERILELEEQEKNLEQVLGLTRREKIKRLLQKPGLGVVFAGAIAGIASLIMNIINPVGRGLKKLGNEAGKEFKKIGKQWADTGKKLAASIPGLLGSVLSLILKTGGELLKFIGNNIWILVVALGAVLLKWMTEKR